MNSIFRLCIFILPIGLMNGCAHSSRTLPDGKKSEFYSPSKDSRNATLYLKCGKTITDTGPSPIEPACTYIINGVMYTKVDAGQVGRIEIKGGNISVDNSAYHTPDPIKNIEILPGTSALLDTDFYIQQVPAHYAILGVVGAVAHTIEQANAEKQPINAPLTIYTKDVASMVSKLQPVEVAMVPK